MKMTDEFNRSLKKNIYISKIKDVASFVQLINNIYKSIIGRIELREFFYKFDRVLSIKIMKVDDTIFGFEIFLKNVKSNFQMYLEDLYSLLYLFFIDIEIKDVLIEKNNDDVFAKLNIKFDVKTEHNLLIRDLLLRIKHIKKARRLMIE